MVATNNATKIKSEAIGQLQDCSPITNDGDAAYFVMASSVHAVLFCFILASCCVLGLGENKNRLVRLENNRKISNQKILLWIQGNRKFASNFFF